MVQTREGALQNPWIRQIKRCASMYKEEKEARATAPRRRLNQKSPEEALYKRRRKEESPKEQPEERRLLAIKDREPARPKPAVARPARAAAAAASSKPAAAAPAAAPPQPAAAAAAGPAVISTLPLEARRPLLKFVNKARAFLQKQEGNRTTAARLYKELASVGDLKEALKEAGLPVKTPIVSFVKAFPLFVLETGAMGGTSHVGLK